MSKHFIIFVYVTLEEIVDSLPINLFNAF